MERCQPQADLGGTCRSHPVAVSDWMPNDLQNPSRLVLVVIGECAHAGEASLNRIVRGCSSLVT